MSLGKNQVDVIPLASILSRPNPGTRRPDAMSVLELAESIAAIGLLEPIVIDRGGRLVAGQTRFEALRLLAALTPEAREAMLRLHLGSLQDELPENVALRVKALSLTSAIDVDQVPVRRLGLDAASEPNLALAAEVAENEHRRAYTRDEIIQLADRLRGAGFVDRAGRPKKNEKALRPALSAIVGKSRRTVERILTGEAERRGRPRLEAGRTRKTLVLSVDAALDRELKALASREGRTVSAVAREALRRGLKEKQRLDSAEQPRLEPRTA